MTTRTASLTIEDVARHAGVSRAAVSKVLRDAYGVSDSMRTRVQASIDELGYRPKISARGMRGQTWTLGFEIPSIQNHFFPKIITGATKRLAGSRYQLIIAPAVPEDDGYQAIQALADRQVDGLVTITRVAGDWLEALGAQLPLVTIGRHFASANFDTIVGDDLAGAAHAVDHLYHLGHRRIVHLTLEEIRGAVNNGAPHTVRAEGYRQAMIAKGLQPQVVLVDPSQGDAREATLALLAEADGPVAVFAAHDELALGVLEAVAELGLSPADASVVGYDDTDVAAHPMVSLTSVNQSGTQMGEIAARLLLERIAGRTEPVHEVVPTKVMARGSSAAPRPHVPKTAGGRPVTKTD